MSNEKHTAKRTALFFITALMIVSVLTACQPTPAEPVIVNKNDGRLEAQISGPPKAPDSCEAPAHWKETVQKGKLTIEIDTDIILPNVKAYPVVKLEPVAFTQQRIDELVNYFAPGKKLYEWPSVMTKADYEKDLIEAKKGAYVDGKYVVTEDSLRVVKELEEKIRNAPKTYKRKYSGTKLTYLRDLDGKKITAGGENFLNVAVENGDHDDALITVSNYTEGFGDATGFSYGGGNGYTTESFYKQNEEHMFTPDVEEAEKTNFEKLFSEIKIAGKEAQARAEKVLSDLEISGIKLVNAEKAVLHSWDNLWGISSNRPDTGGYIFEYMRESGGIAGFELTGWGGSRGEEPPAYAPPFPMEFVSIFVSEEGVEDFRWQGCSRVVETVSENAPLLPFEKMQKALTDQIYYKQSFGLDMSDLKEMKVSVKKAGLRVGYIGVKDNVRQALLVPVWVFNCAETYTQKDGDAFPGNIDDYLFNAIDGGVIGMNIP